MLPLMLAGYILWPVDVNKGNSTLTATNKYDQAIPKESIVDTSDTAKKQSAPTTTDKTIRIAEEERHNKTTKKIPPVIKNNVRATAKKSDAISQPSDDTYKTEVVETAIVEAEVSVAVTATPADVEKQRKTITLVYTASDVSQYLDKNPEDEATSSSKKPSTLKKLLMKANDLSAQDPLGELRQKKNEILALNFKGKGNVDKTSKQ